MIRRRFGNAPSRVLGLAVLGGLIACSGGEDARSPGGSATDSLAALLREVPFEARVVMGTGDPRSSRYWVQWSTCGENSRAETARANGGREAGWYLLDDLLDDPGISLGDHPVATCEEGVAILQPPAGGGPVAELAKQLLAAELNRAVRSATCAAAQEMLVGGRALLRTLAYDGSGIEADSLEAVGEGTVEAVTRVTGLLRLYNAGSLCL